MDNTMDELFHGPNAGYMLELYERYRQNPALVDSATQAFFAAMEASSARVAENPPLQTDVQEPPPSKVVVEETSHQGVSSPFQATTLGARMHPSDSDSDAPHQAIVSTSTDNGDSTPESRALGEVVGYHIPDIVSAARLTRFIRELGHLAAHIDPLGNKPPGDPGLDLAAQGLTPEKLMDMPASVVRSPLAKDAANAFEAIQSMREVYCGSIGYEDDHIQVHEERAWLRESVETRRFFQDFSPEYQRELLERLTEVEGFERFLHQTFPGQKRFSIEGNDMLIPMLDSIMHNAAMSDTREVVIGMAHRGRLNVLAHVLGKTYSAILAEFQGPNYYNKGTYLGWTGDVKYHLGARRAYRESGIFEMPLTLAPNPSHLESVNPVVVGRARAVQEQRNQPGEPIKDQRASAAILIHGDASFPGQGVVAETLNLSRLKGYHVGGTIHIIINNQIGFTTDWHDSRSTLYASDLAKGFEIPVVHVNADDPIACVAAARMAWAYRERFGKDFLIDLVGYRRWGHNEGDEPSFTQPIMYDRIPKHPTVRVLWGQRLEREGIITPDKIKAVQDAVQSRLQMALREVERGGRVEATMAVSVSGFFHRHVAEPPVVSKQHLIELNNAMVSIPSEFTPLPKMQRLLQRRRDAIHEENGIDWAHAEALAFATILAEGIPIRLTGQDAERGTFSQRHFVIHNVETGEQYVSLQKLPQAKASFAVHNSPLSENGAMGFEYGYSSHAPDTLVLWEAQFGDFCNAAQVFIDQFIVAGYAKWGQTPALVLLLPHGYEGQGPEHSSARLERFLQLAADNNMRIVNCTTSGQYFHLLRRQASRLQGDPRPLIVMTPKSLLRNPHASSSLKELVEGTFHSVFPPVSGSTKPEDVKRLIVCSGKVYVDLIEYCQAEQGVFLPEGMAVARVEELYPFPANDIEAVVQTYHQLQDIVWLQEEPRNMGAWSYMEPRLRELIGRVGLRQHTSVTLTYCGRAEAASTAEGTLRQHQEEQTRILQEVILQ